jgi:hypothetical protein
MPVGALSFMYAYMERKSIPHCRKSVRSIRLSPLGGSQRAVAVFMRMEES